MQLDLAVRKQNEGGWRYRSLGHVEDADLLRHGNAGALEIDTLEEAVHLSGGDALAALCSYADYGVENAMDVCAFRGRNEEHRRIVQVFESMPELFFEDGAVCRGLAVGPLRRHQIPLVDHDDDRAAALVRVASDGGVGCGDAFRRVDEEDRHVGGFEMFAGHHD